MCLASAAGTVRVFFDAAGSAPPADSTGRAWMSPDYLQPPAWYNAPVVTVPRETWVTPCGSTGLSRWVAAFANTRPPTLADAYFRSEFTMPSGCTVESVTLSLSGDNIVEAWANGNFLGRYEGPYEGETGGSLLYTRCVNITVNPSFLRPGVNVLAFRLINQTTSHGLVFEMCASYRLPCGQPTSTWTPPAVPTATFTKTPTLTKTPIATWTKTATRTASWTPTRTGTPQPTVTFTNTATPTRTASATSTRTMSPTVTLTGTSTPTPTATKKPWHHGCPPVAYPNPCHGGKVRFYLPCGPYDRIECRISTLSMRCVHRRDTVLRENGEDALEWDLRDEQGHQVANGVYYATFRLFTGDKVEQHTCKVLILR
jgi:hypothetical protein